MARRNGSLIYKWARRGVNSVRLVTLSPMDDEEFTKMIP